MTTGSEVAVRNTAGGLQTRPESGEPFNTGLVVSQVQIEQTKTSLTLLRTMIKEVLVQGRDYGAVPGIPDEFLWDPGASQITASFNCRVGPGRVIKEVFSDSMVAVVLEVPIISFQTGQEVACCIGAASTTEVKHKYRWISKFDLADWGYNTNEQIATLKKKKFGKAPKEYFKYRINNPEPSELLNTIWKIAHKRGRVGAAQLLPGVSSALREKFAKEQGGKPERKPTSDWDLFWAEMTQWGLNESQVHAYLGMKSVKDWVGTGQTLDQAKDFIKKKMAAEKPGKPPLEEEGGPDDFEGIEPPDFLEGNPLAEKSAVKKTKMEKLAEGSDAWFVYKIATLGISDKAITDVLIDRYKFPPEGIVKTLGDNFKYLKPENREDLTKLLKAKEKQLAAPL